MQVSRENTESLDRDYPARGMPTLPRIRCVLRHWLRRIIPSTQAHNKTPDHENFQATATIQRHLSGAW